MSGSKPLAFLLVAALAGCSQPAPPVAEPSASPAAGTLHSPVSATTATASASPSPALFELPANFRALGTEPFWAAKVAGGRLTYMTPEDQAGTTIAVERVARAEFVELRGTLAGKPLALTISKGPCSDGMSDVVYRWSVERRLGDDEQRGCARTDADQAGERP